MPNKNGFLNLSKNRFLFIISTFNSLIITAFLILKYKKAAKILTRILAAKKKNQVIKTNKLLQARHKP